MTSLYRFLVDANLPRNFRFFRGKEFVHQLDLDPKASDSHIWEFAKTEGLVILTKDTDFYFRCQANISRSS
ncbi:MAG: hypothetical protein D6722_17265 [Bacteroidetes bacterium]|nr:MAG: hypothetical protein D6722_17265 [Bacteroidota bacterium]